MDTSTTCRICDAVIQVATAERTDGRCMRCFKGTRYRYVDYLSIEEFFAKASDYSLAPNLEPHPTKADFRDRLLALAKSEGVERCFIPVVAYEEGGDGLEPYSDRIFFTGSQTDAFVDEWARQLGAEFYREKHPGEEIPKEQSNGQPGWMIVWD